MKNRDSGHFRQLRWQLFLRTAALLAIAAASIYALYTLLLRGNFAAWTVSLLQNLFGMEHSAALDLYQRLFRSHTDGLIWLSMALVFFALFQVYLRWFTRYFQALGQGLDALLRGVPGEISLPPELLFLERKLNAAKRAMENQRSETRTSEQRKNDLVMYLAHDLKTPLASAVSYLSLLRDEPQLTGELREKYLSIALDKTERLEDLINEFLEIAKYDLSDVTLQYSRIDLGRLLEQLIYEFRPILDQKRLTCRLSAPDDLILKCDGDKIQHVFDNLLRNAALYSSEGTEIAIAAGRQGDRLTLTFSNRGETIPREKLERIFEKFYRLDAGRGGAAGSGLGLAIAKQIVTLHGGTITASSSCGLTVFTVTLPVL